MSRFSKRTCSLNSTHKQKMTFRFKNLKHTHHLANIQTTMAPLVSSFLSDSPKDKSVRFDENLRVVVLLPEAHRGPNRKDDEDYAPASDDSDNETNATVMRSVLFTSNTEIRSMPARLPMELFVLSSTYSPERSSSKDDLAYTYSLRPLSMPKPAGTCGCINIINSALECVESVETKKVNDESNHS